MLSSAQVAALVAQQNQMFVGTAQYAQQISASMPGAYQSGLGAFGVGSPVQAFPQVPYAPQHQPGFSYGGSTMLGYGLGNQAAAVGMSALGSGANAAISGLGIAGSLGMLGKAGMLFDPFSAGSAAFGVARGAGMGMVGSLGMGALGASLPMAGMAFARHAVGSMVSGAQEQAGLERVMSQFQHINPASRTGRGFTRQDAMAMGDMVRHLQSMPEMLTSFSEMSRLLDKVGQMGLMQGARDIGEFQRKFKDIVGTLKNVSKVMGTSMEEAAVFMGEARRSGFYSQADITKNAFARQLTGGLTGMNQGQVNAIQQYGAQVSFSTGGSRASGARHALRTANQLGMMNQLGYLTNDQIAEMTGEEGAAGIQQLAGTLTEAAHRMSRSNIGKAMTLALGEQKDGRYTGRMDQDLAERFRRGEIGKEELIRLARSKSSSRKAKLSYAAQKNRLRSEMASAVGVEGISMELQTILGERGWDNPDAVNLVMQRYGLDERQAGMVQQLMQKMPNIQRGMMGSAESDRRRIAEQSYYRENLSLDAIKRKISKRIENTITEPLKKIGANIRNSIHDVVDEFVDGLTGRYSAELTKGASNLIIRAGMGSKAAQEQLQQASSFVGRRKFGGDHNIVRAGGLEGFIRGLQGEPSMGDNAADFLRGFKGGQYADRQGNVDLKKAQQAAADLERTQGSLSPTRAKLLEGNPLYKQFQAELRQTLEIHGRDLEKLDPLARAQALQERLKEVSGKKVGFFGSSVYERMFGTNLFGGNRSKFGTDAQGAILHSLQQQGLLGQMGSIGADDMAKALRGMGTNMSLAKISEERRRLEKSVSRQLGEDAGDIIGAVKGGGHVADLIVGGIFQGGGSLSSGDKRNKLKELINQRGEVTQEQVDALMGKGVMTKAQFEKARPTLGKALKKAGDVTPGDVMKLAQFSLAEAVQFDATRMKEVGASLRGRLEGAEGTGVLDSKSGRKTMMALSKLQHDLEEGRGPAKGSIGDLAEQLAGAEGEEGKILRRVAGGELGAATSMYSDVSKFLNKRGRRKVSIEDLGTKFGIDFNAMPELRTQIEQTLGKGDKSGKNAVAKLLADLAGRGALHSPGGKQGSLESDLEVSKNLDKFSDNVKKLAEIIGGMKSEDAKSGKPPTSGS